MFIYPFCTIRTPSDFDAFQEDYEEYMEFLADASQPEVLDDPESQITVSYPEHDESHLPILEQDDNITALAAIAA